MSFLLGENEFLQPLELHAHSVETRPDSLRGKQSAQFPVALVAMAEVSGDHQAGTERLVDLAQPFEVGMLIR
jgi:hypothetical protein